MLFFFRLMRRLYVDGAVAAAKIRRLRRGAMNIMRRDVLARRRLMTR